MTIKINQIKLVSAMADHLAKEHGVKDVSARHLNAIIRAADIVVAEFTRADIEPAKGCGLVAWLAGDHVGLSGKYMASILAPYVGAGDGWKERPFWPLDPSDFNRCVKLLDCVPEMRPHLSRMSACDPVWAGYVAHWDEMERLLREELPSGRSPKLYELMKGIRKAAGAR